MCPSTNSPSWKELLEAVGDPAAYFFFNKNEGKPMDQTPNGKISPLFKELLASTNGDRIKAIQLKAKYYTQAYLATNDWLSNFIEEPKLNPEQLTSVEREYTPENITTLKPNEVFVFGANTAGGHGGGTAGLAQRGTTSSNYTALPIGTKGKWSEYGIVDKLMQGTEGKSFGIVTKAATISGASLKIGAKRSVTLSRIEESINALIKTASENPSLKFLVTKFGTNMAGFSVQEMKSLLENKNLPDNIILPKEFEVRNTQSSTNNVEQEDIPNVITNNELTITQGEIDSLKTYYLHLSNPGDVLYTKEGTKFTVLSKKDKYGRSLEYKVEEKMNDGSIRTDYTSLNPKTTRGENSYYSIDLSKYRIVNDKSESTFNNNGLILNTGQKEALAKFTKFLEEGRNKFFLLKGRAGTGKTTIASTMMKVAKEKGFKIFATAISDAATTNLSTLSKNTPDSDIRIYNFAAMYGLVPQYDDSGNMTGFDFPSENSQIESDPKIYNANNTLLLFDESSMVSQETLSKIQKLTPDITILYMGDNAQIMPIGDTKISTVFSLEDQHELTEVMRQKGDSPILDIASNIAKEIDIYDNTDELKLTPILDNVYTNFDKSKNSGAIITNFKETFINEAVEDFKKYGNKQTLVITGNNDNVESLNKEIREKIITSNEQFVSGERLMTYSKYSKYIGKNIPKIEIFNSSVVTILSVSPSTIDGVPTNELSIEYVDQEGKIKQTYMKVIHKNNKEDIRQFYENKKRLNIEYKKTRDRGILAKLNEYSQTVLVDYAYAMTAHKAQGQTVRNTYVLPTYRGFSDLEARRMFYTSITRPTDKLVIFEQKAKESNTNNTNKEFYNKYKELSSELSEEEFNSLSFEEQQTVIEQLKNCK